MEGSTIYRDKQEEQVIARSGTSEEDSSEE